MNRLVSDLLDVANMEAGTFTVQRRPFDLRALLEATRERFELLAREKNITLEWDPKRSPEK